MTDVLQTIHEHSSNKFALYWLSNLLEALNETATEGILVELLWQNLTQKKQWALQQKPDDFKGIRLRVTKRRHQACGCTDARFLYLDLLPFIYLRWIPKVRNRIQRRLRVWISAWVHKASDGNPAHHDRAQAFMARPWRGTRAIDSEGSKNATGWQCRCIRRAYQTKGAGPAPSTWQTRRDRTNPEILVWSAAIFKFRWGWAMV